MLTPDDSRLSFEKSVAGRYGAALPKERFYAGDIKDRLPEKLLRHDELCFPELSEPETVRHFVRLSQKNFSVDTHFYPLGSCTMKYNPKVNEWAARLETFTGLHPLQPESMCQGMLELLYSLEQYLAQISGMKRFSLQPAAGAHGELTGMMLVRAYHDHRGEIRRRKVLVPDSSHGTNPASAALLGYHVIELKTNERGRIDLDLLSRHLDQDTACLMLTNPNTLGLFESDILEVTRRVHEKGALLYYDGANLNALLGIARPGDMGFDIVHINLHKTFSTPHGGGGPGAGPVGVGERLIPFLPGPRVEKAGEKFFWQEGDERSLGRVKAFSGNIGVLIRAYVYIRSLGLGGVRAVSEDAVLNANYLKEKLRPLYALAAQGPCLHEFVLSVKDASVQGVHAGDIGKRLLDFGFHAPTVHFPLVVPEALMIEPTESESRETLDRFAAAMKQIAVEIRESPETVRNAPHHMPISRPDEVLAARKPVLCYRDLRREKVLLAGEIPS